MPFAAYRMADVVVSDGEHRETRAFPIRKSNLPVGFLAIAAATAAAADVVAYNIRILRYIISIIQNDLNEDAYLTPKRPG